MMEKHKHCLLCNSTRLKTLKKYAKDHLTQCHSCGFVFSEVIPSKETLLEFYTRYPRGMAISPISIKRYGQILDTFEPYRKNNTLLDVGCGDGHFLEVAKQRGWNVYGTEFTDGAIKVCEDKGISILKGELDAGNYQPGQFDVVTSFEVIEHINNPRPEIEAIKTVLRDDGLFYFTTPNFNSISRTALGAKWNVIHFPEHLCYYTPRTMNRFLKGNGFKQVCTQTTGISVKRFKTSVGMKSNPGNPIMQADEALRIKTETRPFYRLLKKVINGFLNATKWGDNLKGYYQKKSEI